jgi:predicted RNase H-like nuclease
MFRVNSPRRFVLGLDGCRGGWMAVRLDLDRSAPPAALVFPNFDAVLADADRAVAIAVDMPIGFLDVAVEGGRLCERMARDRLGPRRSSVFSAPARATLAYPHDYQAALAANRMGGGVGLSRQSFHLIPKMRELDAAMTPGRQTQVRECHPELAFATLNGGYPMRFMKKTPEGRVERVGVLERAGAPFGIERGFLDLGRHIGLRSAGAARDDLVDAAVAALSAVRIAKGEAITLPAEPPRDAKGLRMEIVA